MSSVVFHAVTVLLMFPFAARLARDNAYGYVAAALFAVFPATTHAVSVVSFREGILATLFLLTALICAMEALLRPRPRWVVGAAVSSVIACLCKEIALMLPAYAMALGATLGARRTWVRDSLQLSALTLPGPVAYIALRAAADNSLRGAVSPVAVESDFIGSLTLFGYHAAIDLLGAFDFRPGLEATLRVNLAWGVIAGFLAVLVMLLAAAAIVSRRRRVVLFSVAWTVLALVPIYAHLCVRIAPRDSDRWPGLVFMSDTGGLGDYRLYSVAVGMAMLYASPLLVPWARLRALGRVVVTGVLFAAALGSQIWTVYWLQESRPAAACWQLYDSIDRDLSRSVSLGLVPLVFDERGPRSDCRSALVQRIADDRGERPNVFVFRKDGHVRRERWGHSYFGPIPYEWGAIRIEEQLFRLGALAVVRSARGYCARVVRSGTHPEKIRRLVADSSAVCGDPDGFVALD